MASETMLVTLVAITVTASLPFYLYDTWVMIDAEAASWDVLAHYLKIIFPGLALNTVPVVTWMLPRLFQQLNGLSALHAILGLQAYAMLIFVLMRTVRIFQAKWEAGLYRDPNQDVSLNDLREDMGV